MAISLFSCSYFGIDTYIVEVEVDLSRGLPVFNIVGMGDQAISESKERIRSCFKNMGFEFPVRRVLVNLSPANIKKKGSHFDLSIFLGILANIGNISNIEIFRKYLILGEISLNGKIKSVTGAINAAILAKEKNFLGVIVPLENYNEAKLISGVEVVPVQNIQEVLDFLENKISVEELCKNADKKNIEILESAEIKEKNSQNEDEIIDFCDVKGQLLAKRALEIAAAGGHNVFLIGDPGSGKSMLAKRFTTILPEMTEEEIIETTKIYSISGLLSEKDPIITKRPFRAPHYSATEVALAGGATRVGEITLALNGVLFLDEIGEFEGKTLETLRQPLEDGKIVISRANFTITYPVKSITITASNPTPSGYFPDNPLCSDSLLDIKRYQKKFSGPFLDRMDLYVEMHQLKKEEMFCETLSEKSESIQKRVIKARVIQKRRFKSDMLNYAMTKRQINKYCKIDAETQEIMKEAIDNLKLSARMFDKLLKVSRTIADLGGEENIKKEHLLEALNYRKK
ncbi:YifB family Mg chelatase-like AAA ATPase [Leptotrichia sp. oral taxon 847]|uniref:YifB family Mg chelatase-like AAA ATPase n=1 Tax=Leptotrichia sp. oral taxon 847 TaxID=1785996 RepID=UPI00076845E7|nr:YifB family Mg chelatase-like AAA ATPase [Leptotrichia sp. oral taxon 847]AMD94711.1 magnesium chelatase [Leptotrichia sp. oral taxon 847]